MPIIIPGGNNTGGALPPGGDTGQQLVKRTPDDFDVEWSSPGAMVAGSSGQGQYNNAGSLAGAAGLVIDPATGRLTLAGFLAGSAPSAPSSGFTLYANASHALSWIGQNGFTRTFDGTANTANRSYTLQNKSGTIAHMDDVIGLAAGLALALG